MVLLSLYHDGIPGIVDDLENDPLEVGIALGCAAGDGVLLLHSQTASFYLIHGGDRHRMSILPHSDRFPGPGRQHGFIRLGLPNLVGAVGKGIVASACSTGFVGRDGHDHISHSVGLAVHHNGVGAAVDDLELYPGKAGVALRCGAGLRILLFQVDSAPNNFIFCLVL